MTDTNSGTEPGHLTVTRAVSGGIGVVTASGEIDHESVGQLREALLPGGAPEPGRVVLDLGAVTFMDSSGINVLVAAYHALKDTQGWLRLARPPAPVLRIIELVSLDTVLGCYPTVEQAATA
ncbi:STAS domain-containing protein [Streptomyces microflavus]|uniref:STAS domain-containing protein n=1 Tax=Streptomyces microflavus TaxID=1919 RepID=UPI0034345D8C